MRRTGGRRRVSLLAARIEARIAGRYLVWLRVGWAATHLGH